MRLYLLSGTLTLKNGKIDKYLFDGGYAQASATSSTSDNFTFYYYTPDHLGNIREVVDAGGNVQQVTNYYPFGATYADAATNADFQPYKYNGKELDKMHGLNAYDYGARQHDPILARWDRIDPLAEKERGISPYAYCVNSPVNKVDPYGETDYTVNRDGYMYESTSFIEKVKNLLGKGSKQDRVYMEGSNKQIVSLPEGAIILLKNDKDFTKVEINDSQSAETFTDAVMKETDVEWARIKHGNKKTVSNTILNNHDDRYVDSAVPTMELYRAKGETIYQFDHSHPIPKNIIGTNAEGLTRIKVSPEDMRTVSKYKPEVSRVMNKQTNEIEYYNSKRVYRYEKW